MRNKFTLFFVFTLVLTLSLSFATALEKKGEYEGSFNVDVGDTGIIIDHPDCSEDWGCSYYTSCDGSSQTFTCVDCNHCGTSVLKPQDCGGVITCSSEGSGGSGGSRGSGSSGTGISIKTSCTEKWECSEWSECINEEQTRTCEDKKNCGTTDLKPSTSAKCGEETQLGNETQTNLSEVGRESTNFFSSITGAFVGALGPTGALGTIIFIVAIMALIILSYAMKKKEKK